MDFLDISDHLICEVAVAGVGDDGSWIILFSFLATLGEEVKHRIRSVGHDAREVYEWLQVAKQT